MCRIAERALRQRSTSQGKASEPSGENSEHLLLSHSLANGIVPMRFFALLLSVAPVCSAMRVAVTGTTGLLGRQVVERLSKTNIKVNALLRHPIDSSVTPSIEKDAKSSQVALYLSNLPGVTMVAGDATDLASCKQLVDKCDAIIAAHG